MASDLDTVRVLRALFNDMPRAPQGLSHEATMDWIRRSMTDYPGGDLAYTLEHITRNSMLDIVLRLRPSYFPFTEPSVEVDVGFALVNGKRVLGGNGDAPGHGWMELLGSGMVNRKVIAAGGLDPDEWQGFAFGIGVDRLAMLKYSMDDLRAFFDGDVRWLAHYGFSPLDVPTLSAGVGARA